MEYKKMIGVADDISTMAFSFLGAVALVVLGAFLIVGLCNALSLTVTAIKRQINKRRSRG